MPVLGKLSPDVQPIKLQVSHFLDEASSKSFSCIALRGRIKNGGRKELQDINMMFVNLTFNTFVKATINSSFFRQQRVTLVKPRNCVYSKLHVGNYIFD